MWQPLLKAPRTANILSNDRKNRKITKRRRWITITFGAIFPGVSASIIEYIMTDGISGEIPILATVVGGILAALVLRFVATDESPNQSETNKVNTMDVKIKVPGIEKLLDYAASGVGSIAGPMLAPWKAGREAKAKLRTAKGEAEAKRILAEGQATSMQIIATAQDKARSKLISPQAALQGEITIGELVTQRVQFQEEKRQANIGSVVTQAANQLGDNEIANHEPDHDWTARFFNDVQDVSSEEMQALWATVLAGEVKRTGSTSIRTLGILKNLDHATASLFRKFCSACLLFDPDDKRNQYAIVPSLGGNAASNSLEAYGLHFSALNLLNEHGLIISDYNSWYDYRLSVELKVADSPHLIRIPFRFQNRHWVLIPTSERNHRKKIRLSGVAMTHSGRELSNVVGLETMEEYFQALSSHFRRQNLQMTEVQSHQPQVYSIDQ